MAVKDVSGTQGSFINRTKTLDTYHPGGITGLVKRVSDEIFEPTGSNFSTAFMLVSGSTEMHKTSFMSASLVGGGSLDGKGLIVGEMYLTALNSVSASANVVIDLYRQMSEVRQIIREAITELLDESRCIYCGDITNEDLRKWFGKGGAGGTTKGGWDRYGSDGQKLGKCGDGKEGGAYAACLSAEKARKLGKKGRAAFVRRKRRDQKKGGDTKKGGQRSKGKKPVYSKTGA